MFRCSSLRPHSDKFESAALIEMYRGVDLLRPNCFGSETPDWTARLPQAKCRDLGYVARERKLRYRAVYGDITYDN